VFRDNRRKKVQPPPALPDIKEVAVIKVIGITFTNNLSVAEHVHNVITSCAQTLYALKVLRVHGMSDSVLHAVCLPGSRHLQVDVRLVCVVGLSKSQ